MIKKREKMVKDQIEKRGVKNKLVLEALLNVERHNFVPEEYQKEAYEDYPLPIGFNQTISQPYIVAFMTELLDIQKSDKILEIGTGSGYHAAILSKLGEHVYTIEIIQELAKQAEKNLIQNECRNVTVITGDGYKGFIEAAPFDKIIVTAAPPEIPNALIEQLKPKGKMVIPVGTFYQNLILLEKTENGIIKKVTLPVRFVPMVRGNDFNE